ncbi:MAG: hypothetical protein Q7T24_05635 [Deltaproteobacteria bacterium]|nr:hypothetical protein [Deltaproteobacteria bacterium]
MATRINFIDLYSFYNELDGSVIETLMEDYRITCSIRTLGQPRIYTEDYLEKRIAVEQEKLESARKIINDAIRSGVISREGKFRV